MSTPVTMPQLGESVTEGTVTRWLKQPGDSVDVDEPLLEVSTDKVDTEIPAPVAGVLLAVDAPEDAIVQVGGQLGTIGSADELSGGGDSAPQQPPAAEAPPAGAPPAAAPTAATGGADGLPPPAFSPPASPPPSAPAAAPPSPATAPAEPPPSYPPPAVAASQATPAPAADASGTAVRLPELGESVTEGTVTRWLKQVGDQVEVDEPLVEISTDKVDTEIPSPAAGVITSIAAGEDAVVEIGAVLAVIGGSGDAAGDAPAAPEAPAPAAPAPEAPAPAASAPAAPAPEAPAPEAPAPTPSAAAPTANQQPTPAAATLPAQSGSAHVAQAHAYVTPLVRKLAADSGVDLASVAGTGVGGRIRRQDVEAAAAAQRQAASAPESAPPAKAPPAQDEGESLRGKTLPMSRLRRVIADRMVESLQTSAQLTTVVEVDVTAIARLRQRAKASFQQREGVNLTFLPFFSLAAVEALKIHPQVNASINPDTNEVTYHDQEALGIAVDTERGLLVPVIRDAGELNLAGIARRIADLAERTRTNRVTPDELSGGTFTVTNTGSRGALFDTPIINQPQVGILGVGSIVKRPVVIAGPDGGDVIAVHSMVYLALTYDHRIVDGADAARFLSTIKERLEEGAFEDEVGL